MRISAPTYTQAPNDLFDKWLPLLKEIELKVLLVIMRKTLGWHKIRDRISISQLQQLTGSTATNIRIAIDGLIEKGLITKEVIGEIGTQKTFYELVIHEDSNNSYPCQSSSPPPANLSSTPPANLAVTKETLKKTNQKKSDLIEPQSGNLTILDFEGREQALTKQDLFSLAVTQNTDWTAQEIELLHERLAKHKGNVRDLISFCKAIIKKERTIQNIDKQVKGKQQCHQKNQSKDLHPSMSPSETIKNQILMEEKKAVGTPEHAFHNWKARLKI